MSKSLSIVAILLFVIVIITGITIRSSRQSTESSEQRDKPSRVVISTAVDGNKLFTNNKYHYIFETLPVYDGANETTGSGSISADSIRLVQDGNFYYTEDPKLYIDIGTIGIFSDEIEEIAERIGMKEYYPYNLNGFEALRSPRRRDDGDMTYLLILAKNQDNLYIMIRFNSSHIDQFEKDIDTVIKTFRFTAEASLGEKITLSGNVRMRRGNCMPSTSILSRCHTKPLSTNIYIYVPVKLGDASSDKKLVAKAKSDNKGNYQLEVPQGTYSIFTSYGCNSFDGYGNRCTKTLQDKDEKYDILVDQSAQ